MPSSIDLHFPGLADVIGRWWQGTHPDGVPPHITLLYPWVEAVTDRDLQLVREVAASTASTEIAFTSVRSFEGVVHLWPEPQPFLRALAQRIERTFPDTPPYGGVIAEPIPHLTIARSQPGFETEQRRQEIEAALVDLLPLRLPIRELSVMEQAPGGKWQTTLNFPLGQR